MKFIRDSDIHHFLGRNQSFLEQEEAANSLMLGLALSMTGNGESGTPPILLTVQDQDAPQFCGLQTPPRNMILYGNGRCSQELIDFFLDHLLDLAIELPGVIGPKNVVSSLTRRWEARTGRRSSIVMDQLIYQLDSVQRVPPAPGAFRVAEEQDAGVIIPWIEQFLLEALGKAPEGEAQMIAEQKIAGKELFLWEDGEIVSMAAVTRPTRHGITVNFVYTPEQHRRKGYATNCVAKLSQRMLEEGYQFCSLFTDQSNPTSNKIYQRIGYRVVKEFQQVDFPRD